MSLFGKRTGDHRAVSAVEAALRALGVDPEESALPARGDAGAAWSLGKGSVEVYVVLTGDADARVLRIFAPILTVPTENPLALFRRLLEINGEGLSGCSFGVRGTKVVLGIERDAQGLDRDVVRDLILHVAHYADHFDDELVRRFGGHRHADE